jgi:hypothetical protein
MKKSQLLLYRDENYPKNETKDRGGVSQMRHFLQPVRFWTTCLAHASEPIMNRKTNVIHFLSISLLSARLALKAFEHQR